MSTCGSGDAPVGAPAGAATIGPKRAFHVPLPAGVEADPTFYLAACADKWDNHVFVGLFDHNGRRFFAHYGIGAHHVCAYADVWHERTDHVLFTVAMRRQPDGTTFEALAEQIKAKMHEWLDTSPEMPLPNIWRRQPGAGKRDRSHLHEGYNLQHHNCRSFAIWLLVQFGAVQDDLTTAFEDAGVAWGIPGHCGVFDAVHEIDALGALVFRYPDGITLTAIGPRA